MIKTLTVKTNIDLVLHCVPGTRLNFWHAFIHSILPNTPGSKYCCRALFRMVKFTCSERSSSHVVKGHVHKVKKDEVRIWTWVSDSKAQVLDTRRWTVLLQWAVSWCPGQPWTKPLIFTQALRLMCANATDKGRGCSPWIMYSAVNSTFKGRFEFKKKRNSSLFSFLKK